MQLSYGRQLPESEDDYLELKRQNRVKHIKCVDCSAPFDNGNTHTEAGWRDTQITGFCEACTDALFQEDNEEDDDPDFDAMD